MKNIIINLALGYLVDALKVMKDLPLLMQLIGKAFGPDGCRHFSELNPEEQTALLLRAPVLTKKHTDWPGPLQKIERTLTCYVMPKDEPPVVIEATPNFGSIDIPAQGNWVCTRGFISTTFVDKVHSRGGFRWDVNDKYLELSFTIKQLK